MMSALSRVYVDPQSYDDTAYFLASLDVEFLRTAANSSFALHANDTSALPTITFVLLQPGMACDRTYQPATSLMV